MLEQKNLNTGQNEPEVLEEIEEVEEAEEVVEVSPVVEGETPFMDFSPSKHPFKNSIFPVLIIDKFFKISSVNKACQNMFVNYFALPGKYFFDIFGKYFDIDDIKKIRETIITGENGYSWKGEARIKSRNMVSVQIKVYIFPLEMNIKEPLHFVVMFDDVTEENRRLLKVVFLSLLEASKLKDNDTGRHITRVNLYSKRMAEELFRFGDAKYMRIDADFIDKIAFLASMHDVGKIGTPDDILNKEGPLSDWEWTVMREHTKNGAFILSTYPSPMAKDIALSHHEKWNGSGYPFQLEGEMIPLAARITTIADVYDALRMERCYKPALSHDTAMGKIVENSGIQFDPNLIRVFIKISKDFEGIYDSNKD